MQLGKVIGNVVSSQKHGTMDGKKLLMVAPLTTRDGKHVPAGGTIVAVDALGAGDGELVLYTTGSSARFTDATKNTPVDAVIIGIVETVEVMGTVVEKP
jgi:ethanolamine utilization protein EutN